MPTRRKTRGKAAAPRVPADLAQALRGYENAYANFRRFAPSQRRGMIGWITDAKRPGTRARRVAEVARFAEWNVETRMWRWKY